MPPGLAIVGEDARANQGAHQPPPSIAKFEGLEVGREDGLDILGFVREDDGLNADCRAFKCGSHVRVSMEPHI